MKADEIAARRVLVAKAILEHKSQREAGTELGIPHATLARDIKAIRIEWQAERVEAIDQIAAEDLQRFATTEAILWPQILGGDLQAIDRWLKLRQERAKLLGTDAPTRLDGRFEIDAEALRWIGDLIARTVTDEETLGRIRSELVRIASS